MIDAQTMLGSFLQSFAGFEDLLNALVAFLGLCLTIHGLFKFVQYSRLGGREAGLTLLAPVMYLACGAALWNFAAGINSLLETFFGPSASVQSILSYNTPVKAKENTRLLLASLIACVRLYGYWSYASGWLTLRRLGENKHGDTFKKGMVKLVAGVFLINIVETVNVVAATFGFGKVL